MSHVNRSAPILVRTREGAPMSAGLAIQATTNLQSMVISPWTGLGVMALWAVGALLFGGLSVHLRDA